MVLIFDPVAGRDYDIETTRLRRKRARLHIPEGEQASEDELRSADVLLVHRGPLTAAHIGNLVKSRGIVVYGVGTDMVDGEAARAANLPVRNIPGYCTNEVADQALALLLALERNVVSSAFVTAQGGWRAPGQVARPHRIRGQTLGILGAGRIGQAVAKRGRGFGFKTIAYDPFLKKSPPGVKLLALDEVLAASDAVVLTLPLTPETRGLIGGDTLARMKKGSFLINVARGPIVDEEALARSLRAGHLGGAALDVRAIEPPPTESDPLRGAPNLILTPHLGATSIEATRELKTSVADVALELLSNS
jgi:D-3-phosphoglycerate dehydrogenase